MRTIPIKAVALVMALFGSIVFPTQIRAAHSSGGLIGRWSTRDNGTRTITRNAQASMYRVSINEKSADSTAVVETFDANGTFEVGELLEPFNTVDVAVSPGGSIDIEDIDVPDHDQREAFGAYDRL